MIFIPGNVPSSKNSKRVVRNNGKVLVINSKITMNYIKTSELFYITGKKKFLQMIHGMEPPYRVSFLFIRDSRRKFDYINPLQTVQDLMVKYGWIEDDNADFLIPVLEQYQYSKSNPGVIISICESKSQPPSNE